MCGRYTLQHNTPQIAMRFDAIISGALAQYEQAQGPRYNIAPQQAVLVVRNGRVTDDDPLPGRELAPLKWGLVPFWAKDREIGQKIINSRAESLLEKPAFKSLIGRRRCLIPSDGFYEWKAEGAKKQPYFIHRRDGELFAFAGLWDRWKGPDGEPLDTCTVITTSPSRLMADIHNRMPAILTPDEEAVWLDPSVSAADAVALLRPHADDILEAYPVSRRVNYMADDPGCIEPNTAG